MGQPLRMRNIILFAIVVSQLGSALPAAGRVYFTSFFPPQEFEARRARVMDVIGSSGVAILRGNEGMPGYHEFVQNNNTFYLSGVESPGAILLIDGKRRETHLFLRPQNLPREASEGPQLIPDPEASRLTGIQKVSSTDQLKGVLTGLLDSSRVVYSPLQPQELQGMSRDLARRYNREIADDPWDGRISREENLVNLLRKRFGELEFKDLSPILDRLRLIKSEREIAALRRATELSVAAILEAMKSTAPGILEYELDALGQFIFLRNGAAGMAYYALVAASKNAYMNHYHAGRSALEDGDFLLFDFGPEFQYYTADVTRMWPVNGKFSPWQRELYGFYLDLYKALLARIRPSVPVRQIMQEVAAEWEKTLARTRFSQDVHRKAAESFVAAYRERSQRTGPVSLGHWVGLATHDVGGPVEQLQPGMVLTIEPQFRIPEKEIYIRLEDMLLVTKSGVENLSSTLPMEIEQIEAVMREVGLLQTYPRTP